MHTRECTPAPASHIVLPRCIFATCATTLKRHVTSPMKSTGAQYSFITQALQITEHQLLTSMTTIIHATERLVARAPAFCQPSGWCDVQFGNSTTKLHRQCLYMRANKFLNMYAFLAAVSGNPHTHAFANQDCGRHIMLVLQATWTAPLQMRDTYCKHQNSGSRKIKSRAHVRCLRRSTSAFRIFTSSL